MRLQSRRGAEEQTKKRITGVPTEAQQVKNRTSIHEDAVVVFFLFISNDVYFFHFSWITGLCQFSTVQQGDPVAFGMDKP